MSVIGIVSINLTETITVKAYVYLLCELEIRIDRILLVQ